MLSKAKENAIKFYNYYFLIISEAIHEATGLKTLPSKQMLQILPIALAQVKQPIFQEIYQMKSEKLFILCISQKKLLRKCTIT